MHKHADVKGNREERVLTLDRIGITFTFKLKTAYTTRAFLRK